MLKPLLCMEYNKLENSERDGNTRPPDLPPEKPVPHLSQNFRLQTLLFFLWGSGGSIHLSLPPSSPPLVTGLDGNPNGFCDYHCR